MSEKSFQSTSQRDDGPQPSSKSPVAGPSNPGAGSYQRCPYDYSHMVCTEDFSNHLFKCRKNFKYTQMHFGESVVQMNCRFNINHRVESRELEHHELHCEDRNKVWSYMLHTARLLDTAEIKYNLEEYGFDQEELAEMYDGLCNVVVGEPKYGDILVALAEESGEPVPVPLEEVEREMARELSLDKLEDDDDEPLLELGAVGIMCDRKSEVRKPPPPVEEEDDDEDWTKNCNRPRFDYMKNLWDPQKPTMTYPIGLNKAQRRQFDRWNAEWRENLMGVEKVGETEVSEFEAEEAVLKETARIRRSQKAQYYPYGEFSDEDKETTDWTTVTETEGDFEEDYIY